MSNHHHHNPAGLFSFFRSIFRPESNTNVGESGNDGSHDHPADPSSRDVDMSPDDAVNDDSSYPAASGSHTDTFIIPHINDNIDDNDDDDLPPLQAVSDTEESEDGGDRDEPMQNESIPPSSAASNVSSHAPSPAPFSIRSGQRRARVEDDDDGDQERDRRHPTERTASRIPPLSAAFTTNAQHNTYTSFSNNSRNRNIPDGLNNVTSSINNADGPHTSMHSLYRDALPFAQSPSPSGNNQSTAHYHILHHYSPTRNTHEGLGGGVPGVGLRAAGEARNIPPPPGTFSRILSQLHHPGSGHNQPMGNSSQGSNPHSSVGQTTPTPSRGPNRNSHNTHPLPGNNFSGPAAGPSLVIPVPFGALPSLLRAIGSAIGENPTIVPGNNPQAHPETGADGPAPANNNEQGNANQSPFSILGGIGIVPGLDRGNGFAIPLPPGFIFPPPFFSFSEERENDDADRGRLVVDGLEEVNEGLVRRLERANQALSEEEGSGCAVCWESLLNGVESEWGAKGGENFATASPTPQPPTDDPSSTSSSQPEGVEATYSTEGSKQQSKKKIVSLPCAHIFHADCLIPWFSRPRQTTCPVCRFDLDPEERVWGRRRRRGMPMGMGGLFGVPPPMPTGTAPATPRDNGDGDSNRPSNVEILNDLISLAELSRILGGGRGPGQHGATPDPVPAVNTAGDPRATRTEASRESAPPTNAAPQNLPSNPEAMNPTNTNDNTASEGMIQNVIERMVMRMLGPAFSNGAAGDAGNNRQPRVRVLNTGQGGGPIQVVMDLGVGGNVGPTAQPEPSNQAPESAPQSPQQSQQPNATSPSSPPNTNVTGTGAGNEHDHRRGPFFTIGFDMFIGPAPGPDGPPGFTLPTGFSMGNMRGPIINNAPTPTNNNRTSPNDEHSADNEQPPSPPRSAAAPSQPDTIDVVVERRGDNDEDDSVPNLDEDGDVIMEFEHIFTPFGESEHEEQSNPFHSQPTSVPSQISNSSSSSSGTRPSSPNGPRLSRTPTESNPHLSRDGSGFSFSGTATSMEDAMRQINETLFAHSGPLPMPMSMGNARRPPEPSEPQSQPRPRPPTTVLPPWMTISSSSGPAGNASSAHTDDMSAPRLDSSREPTQASPVPVPPVQSAPSSPTYVLSPPPPPAQAQAPPLVSPHSTTQTPSPSRTQNSPNDDNTPMTFDQFLRSWNGEERSASLPPLPTLPQTQPSANLRLRHQRRRPHTTIFSPPNTPPARDEDQKWAPPPAPGPTFRERVEKKEREVGFRCWDMSCGIGPSDEDPLVAVESEKKKQVHIMKNPAGLDKGKGKGKEEDEPASKEKINEVVCEHTFHPSCLVSASRVMNSIWANEGDAVEGEEALVSCPLCRAAGVVSREVWEEGVRSC